MKRFKKHMRDSVVSYTSQSMDGARETLEEHFDQVLGSLAEEASSELVQQNWQPSGRRSALA